MSDTGFFPAGDSAVSNLPSFPPVLIEHLLEQLPLPIIIFHADRRIRFANKAALEFAESARENLGNHRGGSIIRCSLALRHEGNCGESPECENCEFRKALESVFETGKSLVNRRIKLPGPKFPDSTARESVVGHSRQDAPLPTDHQAQEFLVSICKCDFFEGPMILVVLQDIRFHLRVEQELKMQEQLSEKELQESRQRFSLAMEATNDGIWDYDLVTGKCFLSSRCYTMLGYEPGAFSATFRGWIDLLHPEDRSATMANFQDAIDRQLSAFETEARCQASNGTWRWILTRGRVMEWNDQGTAVRMLGTHIDITDRKEAEQRRLHLRQAQKMEALGTLASGIAHDFNNVLCAILGFSDIALLQENSPVSREKCLRAIQKAGRRARDLVAEILAFGRQSVKERKVVSLSRILREILRTVEGSLPLEIRLDMSIPVDDARILADPSQIHQVIMNLCSNAIFAMQEPSGSTRPQPLVLGVGLQEIELSQEEAREFDLHEAGRFFQVTVSDTGLGMDPQTQERVFEPYFTTKPSGLGSGLGLAIVLGIVRSHGGGIRLESKVGRGSVFQLVFPKPGDPLGSETFTSPEIPLARGKGERVMFVDDEEDLRQIASSTLSQLGYQVVVYRSAASALAFLEANPGEVDVVLTDLIMPGMTGLEFAKAVLTLRPVLPVVLFTGFADKKSEIEAARIGVCKVLNKPASFAEIARVLHDILEDSHG